MKSQQKIEISLLKKFTICQNFQSIKHFQYINSFPMGSQLSQSQQLRNTFPLSQYKLLPTDKSFPELTFLQKLSDSSVFAVKATDKNKESYEPSNSKHLIKRVEKREIHKKLFEMYEWANANVQGLAQYINLIDKNRKISKSQLNAIVQGAVKGYSAVSKQCFEIQCLQINMRKLRIFNQISLKNGSFNQKQVINSIHVKLIPKSLNDCLQKDLKNSQIWSHVGQCIHQGGILTEKQLLGEYLLQLSNYATKKDFKNKTDGLKNLKASFGTKSFKTVESLLANQDWKDVIKILQTNFAEESLSPLKQIQNNPKTTQTIQFNNEKNHQTQKTIDTEKNKSEKILFQCFKNEQKNNPNPPRFQSPPKQNTFQTYLNIPNPQMDRSRINSTQYYRSVSPIKNEKFLSPTSVKIIREASPPVIAKNYEKVDEYGNFDNLKLTRTKSVLTIFPDVHRDQQIARNRMLSTRNIPNQMFSPEGRQPQNQYLNSPRINSPKYENQNQISQQNINQIQKRRGKKIQFKPSKENPTLKEIVIPEYQWKIKIDQVQGSKKQDEKHSDQRNRNESFLSQEFSELKFQLSDKYFLPNENKNSKPKFFNDQPQKHNIHQTPKIQMKNNIKPNQNVHTEAKHQNENHKSKSEKMLHYPPRQNNNFSINVKEANSQTILVDPQSNISFRKVQKADVSPVKIQGKQSKYIGPVNIKGQKQGQGKIYFPSGGFYVGGFYKDFMHGHGKLYYPCGKLAYEGTFKHDKFHGSGKLYNQTPTFISSFDFRNFNKLELTEKQQTVHKEHHLISAVQKEKKISYWKYYQGEMNYDMKDGKGILMLQNGEKHEGEFREDLVHGKGVFYGQNGKISGRWEDNLLMEVYR